MVYKKVSGTWKRVSPIHTKVSGVWKENTEGHVNVSGVWKEFYSLFPQNLIGFFENAPPAPWTVLNGVDASPDLDGMYLKGHTEEGAAPDGANTHTHESETFNTGYANYSTYIAYNYPVTPYNHTHTMNHGHTETNHEPPYYTMIPAITGANLPANTLLFFDGAVAPTGWTAWADVYDKFIKCDTSASGGTGGATSHSHVYTGYSGYYAGTAKCRDQSPYQAVSKGHNHRHTTNHTHASGNNYPLWRGLLPVRNDGVTSEIPSGIVGFFTGTELPEGWSLFTDLSVGKFAQLLAAGVGTGGANTHDHTHVGMTTGAYNGTPYSLNIRSAAYCYKPHYHSMTGTHTALDNIPYHHSLLVGKKD